MQINAWIATATAAGLLVAASGRMPVATASKATRAGTGAAAHAATGEAAFAALAVGPHVLEMRSSMPTYDVEGTSGGELYGELGLKGPHIGERRFWAVTRWHVEWSYVFDRRQGLCAVTASSVRLDLAITLPQWTTRGRASASLVQRFDAMLGGLRSHEELHADNGRSAAREIREFLSSGLSETSCDGLAATIDRRAQAIVADYSERDRVLDLQSRHGDDRGHFRQLLTAR